MQLSLENTTVSSKEQFEKLILGIVFFANTPGTYYNYSHFGYNGLVFLNQLGGLTKTNNNIIKDYYDNDMQAYKRFIISLLFNDEEPTLFMIDFFIRLIEKNEYNNSIFSYEEIQLFFNEIYLQTLNKEENLNNKVWNIYNKSRKLYEEEVEKIAAIDLIFKNFIIKKDFNQFLSDLINQCHEKIDGGFRVINFYERFFKSKEEFIKEIKFQSKNTYNKDICEEFLTFWSEVEALKNGECLKGFQFKYLEKVQS